MLPVVYFTGEDADSLLQAAADEMLQQVINQYQNGDTKMAGPGPCGDPELNVEVIHDEDIEVPYKDRRGWGYGRQGEDPCL